VWELERAEKGDAEATTLRKGITVFRRIPPPLSLVVVGLPAFYYVLFYSRVENSVPAENKSGKLNRFAKRIGWRFGWF
jgi:hypothetical protein